jgi:hypothetical protein
VYLERVTTATIKHFIRRLLFYMKEREKWGSLVLVVRKDDHL